MAQDHDVSATQTDREAVQRASHLGTTPPPPSTTHPTQRVRWHHVLILGGLTAFGPLSTDMYLPALPAVSQDLGVPMAATQVTLTAGILGLALGQVVAGPLSDARGRRRPLLVGIALFVLSSILCSIAPSLEVLLAVRLMQGLTGAIGVVIALAIARDLYSGVALARCISLLMTVNFLAPAIAPVLGGQLLTVTSWRGIFGAIALISMLLLLATIWALPETLLPAQRQPSALSTTMRAFQQVLANRRFIGYALVCGCAFAAGIVYISVSPFVLGATYGLSPQQLSPVFGVNALGLAGVSQIGGWFVGRVAPRTLLAWGVVLIAAGAIGLLAAALLDGGLTGIRISLFVVTTSLGLIAPHATALALADSTPAQAGSAAALLGVVQLSIGALIAPLVGLAGTTSVLPMAMAIALFAAATVCMFTVFCRQPQSA